MPRPRNYSTELSAKEIVILQLLYLKDQEIAKMLGIEYGCLRVLNNRMYNKLGVDTRCAAYREGLLRGLIELGDPPYLAMGAVND